VVVLYDGSGGMQNDSEVLKEGTEEVRKGYNKEHKSKEFQKVE